MEKIEVTARFSDSGAITPLEFSRQGAAIAVHSVGRSWQTERGIHIMVMDLQSQPYHLFFQLEDATWFQIHDLKPPARPS
ncbi:MAG: hypothetical protein U5K99_03750 [Anaerolineales bacterium]|nr:hypothetical protein [Anaerolineales bacterium]